MRKIKSVEEQCKKKKKKEEREREKKKLNTRSNLIFFNL